MCVYNIIELVIEVVKINLILISIQRQYLLIKVYNYIKLNRVRNIILYESNNVIF